jgi:hypothetical protein
MDIPGMVSEIVTLADAFGRLVGGSVTETITVSL